MYKKAFGLAAHYSSQALFMTGIAGFVRQHSMVEHAKRLKASGVPWWKLTMRSNLRLRHTYY